MREVGAEAETLGEEAVDQGREGREAGAGQADIHFEDAGRDMASVEIFPRCR